MLMIKLYDSTSHGMVHYDEGGCWHTRRRLNVEPPAGYEWDGAGSVEEADLKFPNHTLYWCSLCFGSDNPRRFG